MLNIKKLREQLKKHYNLPSANDETLANLICRDTAREKPRFNKPRQIIGFYGPDVLNDRFTDYHDVIHTMKLMNDR